MIKLLPTCSRFAGLNTHESVHTSSCIWHLHTSKHDVHKYRKKTQNTNLCSTFFKTEMKKIYIKTMIE